MRRRPIARLVTASATLLLVGSIAPGCIGGFGDGPYTCNPGFASCNGGGTGSNAGCETNIASDVDNCGSCGNSCGFSSICKSGTCTAPALVLTTQVDSSVLEINATSVYGWGATTLTIVSKSGLQDGGTVVSVPLSNALEPHPGTPFAVDDPSVYYVGSYDDTSSPPQTIYGVYATPADGRPSAPRLIGTFPASAWSQHDTVPTGMYLVNGTLFTILQTSPFYLNAWSVPVSGGTMAGGNSVGLDGEFPPTTAQAETKEVATDGSYLYFFTGAPGSAACEIQRAPLGGDTADYVVSLSLAPGEQCPSAIAEDATGELWWGRYPTLSVNGTQCQNGTLQVTRAIPMATPRTAGEIPNGEAPLAIAVDGSGVYLLTDRNLWKYPPDGSPPVLLAAQLKAAAYAGPNDVKCSNLLSSGVAGTLLLDATSVYAAFRGAVPGGVAGYVLEIP